MYKTAVYMLVNGHYTSQSANIQNVILRRITLPK